MSFASYVARIFGKRPVWLYRVEIPGGATYHMTSRGRPFTSSAGKPEAGYTTGQAFAKTALLNRGISRTTSSQRAEMEVMLPTVHPLAQAVLGYTGNADIKVTVWKTYAGDPDEEYAAKFYGRVVKHQMGFLNVVLFCEESFTAMRRSSVALVVQRPCRHAHYFTNDDGGGCQLDITDWQQSMSVTVVNKRTLTAPLAALQPEGTLTGGILFWSGQERFVESHIGETLVIESVLTGLDTAVAGGPVSVLVAPGCNLSPQRCVEFDNIGNFGGFWWIEESPFDGRSIA